MSGREGGRGDLGRGVAPHPRNFSLSVKDKLAGHALSLNEQFSCTVNP